MSEMGTHQPQALCCPYCFVGLDGGSQVCPACHAGHHDDCWAENNGCAVLGCSAAPETADVAEATSGLAAQSWTGSAAAPLLLPLQRPAIHFPAADVQDPVFDGPPYVPPRVLPPLAQATTGPLPVMTILAPRGARRMGRTSRRLPWALAGVAVAAGLVAGSVVATRADLFAGLIGQHTFTQAQLDKAEGSAEKGGYDDGYSTGQSDAEEAAKEAASTAYDNGYATGQTDAVEAATAQASSAYDEGYSQGQTDQEDLDSTPGSLAYEAGYEAGLSAGAGG